MDPLNIYHVIRHPLSRIQTNNFQDKSGCSINGIRSFLFEEGMVQNHDGMEQLTNSPNTIQDYRGYPIQLDIYDFNNFPLSDEILRMKNVRINFLYEPKPIHKLVSPEPHFVEEERNLIENMFSYLGSSYESEDLEEWECFEMDCEGHLVSMKSRSNFHLSNETIEHLSNFPYLRNFEISSCTNITQSVTNLSFLSSLRNLSIIFEREYEDQEFFKDLGLFTNLIYLDLCGYYGLKITNLAVFHLLYYIFCIFLRSYDSSSLFFQFI